MHTYVSTQGSASVIYLMGRLARLNQVSKEDSSNKCKCSFRDHIPSARTGCAAKIEGYQYLHTIVDEAEESKWNQIHSIRSRSRIYCSLWSCGFS